MPSPSGIFQGLSAAELASLRATALSRIANGDFKQLSGAAKSSTKEEPMDPRQMLLEVKYAEGTLGPQTIYQNYRGLRPMPGTVTQGGA
jgi:ATP-dependent DNA ligase